LGALLPCLAILACSPGVRSDAPVREFAVSDQHPAAAEAPAPLADASSTAGEWDVVSFEGYEPRRLSGTKRAAVADFGQRGVKLRIECNDSGRVGRVSNGRFVPGDNSMAGQTVMSCGPERNERESRYFTFFEKNPTVEHIAPDRLLLRAGGTELVLARPAVNRLRFVPTPAELEGKWRMVELTRYLTGGGYTGGGLSEVPGRIVFSGDRLFYNRCPHFGVTFRLEDSGTLKKTGGAAAPSGELNCRELSGPAAAPRQPALGDILRILHADPTVERVDKDSLLISTQEFGLLITKASCERLEQSNDHRRSGVSDCASPE
jgi:heat shock protein HslJ